ncbi:MAG: hypothetical protein ACFB9M_13565 [Myxococcota bacterium]
MARPYGQRVELRVVEDVVEDAGSGTGHATGTDARNDCTALRHW